MAAKSACKMSGRTGWQYGGLTVGAGAVGGIRSRNCSLRNPVLRLRAAPAGCAIEWFRSAL